MADAIIPTYKAVDTCAAEFEAYTPYFYSTYEEENEALPVPDKESVIILGSGPNRIGQGIEFDYCCVHAVQEMRELGYQAIMVNCNPETVSTDYDTSDRLYFEPLTFEDVLNIIENEKPKGVVVQFGGQTPLKIAERLHAAGVPILGTSQDAIDLAEDRERFGEVLKKLKLKAPPFGTVRNEEEALAVAERIGYPVLVRPSYVLGGRAMEIVYDEESLQRYLRDGGQGLAPPPGAHRPLPRALHRDRRGRPLRRRGRLHRRRHAARGGGRHPLRRLGLRHPDRVPGRGGGAAHRGADRRPGPGAGRGRAHERAVRRAAERPRRGQHLRAGGQPARQPHGALRQQGHRRARWPGWPPGSSPARSCATWGCPVGRSRSRAGRVPCRRDLQHVAVKEAVLPFPAFPGVDTTLGPEMKSTGEVMGVGTSFPEAFAKASLAAGDRLPREGTIFISVADAEKDAVDPHGPHARARWASASWPPRARTAP